METPKENSVFIQVESAYQTFKTGRKVSLSLESIIIYSIYKYCAPADLALHFVFRQEHTGDTKNCPSIVIGDPSVVVQYLEDVPWQAASCAFPVVKHNDTVITGLCAVARHICKHRTTTSCSSEHEEGLLGFRHSCLQAPNEASVWTKFCEIDVINTTKKILNGDHDKEFPESIARFESHLQKPVKVHNVYKVARNAASKNSLKKHSDDNKASNNDVQSSQTSNTEEQLQAKQSKSRSGKSRKWKSASYESHLIPSSTPIEQLNIDHIFAEGPFLTLADLVLYPCYTIIVEYYSDAVFADKMPYTAKWLFNMDKIEGIVSIKNLLNKILTLNDIKRNDLCEVIAPPISDVSLYKCDPKRHNPKKRLYTKEADIEEALSTLIKGMELNVRNTEENEILDWECIPSGANPKAGHLPDKRMDRKCQQLENLATATVKYAKKGDLIVDFCSGSGHLGILVAHLLPECTVILLENKEQSLMRARARVHQMRLKNVYFFQCNLDFYIGKFDIGLALHACGIASDLVLDKCLKSKAKFIICPCCYGSLHSTDRLQYPRSSNFSCLPIDQYMCIGHAADQTHSEHPLAVRGARCMAVIDSDRARLAEECGYTVTLSRLKPLTCTTKNNLLIGVPA